MESMMQDEVKRLCDEFLEKPGIDTGGFKYTPKLKKGLQIPDDAVVYLAHDDTVFNSGKNGFAITSKGIYCRDMMEKTQFTGLEELGSLTEPDWDDENSHARIVSGERLLVYYSDSDEDTENALLKLVSDIIQMLSGKSLEAPEPFPAAEEKSYAEPPLQGTAAPVEETAAPEQRTAAAAQGAVAPSAGGHSGFGSVSNVLGFTDEQLYERLSYVKVSFGTPVMGDINGTPAVLYKNVTDDYDIFCRVNGRNVIMGKIGADGVSSLQTAASQGLGMMFGTSDESSTAANRAVDELCGVVQMLESGENVTESAASSLGEPVSLYMIQKALALKPKFDIVDQNNNPVYQIAGDLARVKFSILRNGEEVLRLRKKLVAILPEYSIEKNNTEIARIKKKLKLTNPELGGQINGKEIKIDGDLFGDDFDILVGGAVIGHVDKQLGYWSDHYRIRSFDPAMQDVMVALSIICDNISDKEEVDT